MNTCHQCGDPFEGRKRKYCTKACSNKAGRESNTKTCTAPDCEKPVRARNLCSTHYNQARPNRHPKVEVPCAWCGTLVSATRKASATCSDQCRTHIKYPPKCALPEDHWARWWGKSSPWPRYGFKRCWWCDARFVPTTPRDTTCGTDCPQSPRNSVAAMLRRCADCNAEYRSPWFNVRRCDTCSDTRRRRGSNWITRPRREAIYQRDDYMCHLCGDRTDPTTHHLDDEHPSLDHLVPRSKGGSDRDYNLKTAHRRCNALRQDEELPMLQIA